MDDQTLLRDYVETGSSRAFATLVERHVDLVYSAALRRTRGDPHRAKEVTQMVFMALAKKAASLTRHTLLIGWLYRCTGWEVANLLRAERRRHENEQRGAAVLLTDSTDAPPDWDAIRPWLDEALDQLRQSDREAVLLRFFQNRPFGEVAAQLGIPENTARMRVTRALEKLSVILRKKGVTTTVTAVSVLLAQNTVSAAPAGMVASLSSAALAPLVAGAGAANGVTLSGLIMAKLNYVAATAALIALGWGLSSEMKAFDRDRAALAAVRQKVEMDRAALAEDRALRGKLDAALARLNAAASTQPIDPVLIERRRLDLIVRKGELDYEYAALFWKLRLDPARLEKFKELLVNRKQAIYDANQLAKEEKLVIGSYAESQEIAREATRDLDLQMVALLGTQNFAEFIRYHDNPYRNLPREKIGNPEAMRQAEALGDLFEQTAGEYRERNFAARMQMPLPDAFVAGAKNIMNAEDYAQLLAQQRLAEAYFKLADISVEAAYAGKLKLRKSSARDYAIETAKPSGEGRP